MKWKKWLGLCGNPQLVFNRNGESPILFCIFCMRTCGYIPKSQSEHLLPKSGWIAENTIGFVQLKFDVTWLLLFTLLHKVDSFIKDAGKTPQRSMSWREKSNVVWGLKTPCTILLLLYYCHKQCGKVLLKQNVNCHDTWCQPAVLWAGQRGFNGDLASRCPVWGRPMATARECPSSAEFTREGKCYPTDWELMRSNSARQ